MMRNFLTYENMLQVTNWHEAQFKVSRVLQNMHIVLLNDTFRRLQHQNGHIKITEISYHAAFRPDTWGYDYEGSITIYF